MDKKALGIGKEFEGHVGRIIARFRKLRGYTQDNLGADLGVSGRTVGKYEKAKIPVRASTMAAVSQALEFDMIEYILFDEVSVAERFKGIVNRSRIDLYRSFSSAVPATRVYDFMDIEQINRTYRTRSTRKDDILHDFPQTRPLPLCSKDDDRFMLYMTKPDNRDKLRMLYYGYELLCLYEEIGAPQNTSSSLAKQLLKQMLKDPIYGVDQEIYAYYWKCIYDR